MGNKNNLEIERRFLVSPEFSPMEIPGEYEKFRLFILQIYLCAKKGKSERIRKILCECDGSIVYIHTKKSSTADPRVRREVEKEISFDEFVMLQRGCLSDHDQIEKVRTCFHVRGRKFELDYFLAPARIKGLMILEIELDNPNQKVELPYFIPIACEITGTLSNAQLSKKVR